MEWHLLHGQSENMVVWLLTGNTTVVRMSFSALRFVPLIFNALLCGLEEMVATTICSSVLKHEGTLWLWGSNFAIVFIGNSDKKAVINSLCCPGISWSMVWPLFLSLSNVAWPFAGGIMGVGRWRGACLRLPGFINLAFQQVEGQVSWSVRDYFPHGPCHVQVASKCWYGIQEGAASHKGMPKMGCWLIGDIELPLGKKISYRKCNYLWIPQLCKCVQNPMGPGRFVLMIAVKERFVSKINRWNKFAGRVFRS